MAGNSNAAVQLPNTVQSLQRQKNLERHRLQSLQKLSSGKASLQSLQSSDRPHQPVAMTEARFRFLHEWH